MLFSQHMKSQDCNLLCELSVLRENKMILPWGYQGLVSQAFQSWLLNAQRPCYQKPASTHQKMILRLISRCQLAVAAIHLTGQEHRHLPKSHPKPLALGGTAVETTKSLLQIGLSCVAPSGQTHNGGPSGGDDFWPPAGSSTAHLEPRGKVSRQLQSSEPVRLRLGLSMKN